MALFLNAKVRNDRHTDGPTVLKSYEDAFDDDDDDDDDYDDDDDDDDDDDENGDQDDCDDNVSRWLPGHLGRYLGL